MEDTLRAKAAFEGKQATCLNPCFNGRYSQSQTYSVIIDITDSLNPCFNGRYSQRVVLHLISFKRMLVLILVLMEDTLRDYRYYRYGKE